MAVDGEPQKKSKTKADKAQADDEASDEISQAAGDEAEFLKNHPELLKTEPASEAAVQTKKEGHLAQKQRRNLALNSEHD